MRAARPTADVALTNGGGVRADLPAGPLTYGRLFEALPFDNRFATVPLTAADLATIVARNLRHENGIISISGIRAQARCAGGELVVTLLRPDGRTVAPATHLTLVTSDFLATGGDGLLPADLLRRAALEDGPPIRDAVADRLRTGKTAPSDEDRALFDPARPRLAYPEPRPVRCSSRAANSPL
jgi:2',3'-cyclic-nucleotide 2'-phosphodiesterase (5'-nucleotidase family)